MRYFRRLRTKTAARQLGEPLMQAQDPMSGVANLFDCSVVFIVALILALFNVYHLQDLFSEKSDMTIMKQDKNGQMEIITKKGTNIKAIKVTKEKSEGRGERLGVAYKLEDGTMVYVPE